MKQWDVKSNISQPIVPQALGGLGITTSGSVLALLGRIVGDVHRLETYRTIIGDHRVSKEMLIVAFGEIKALHGSARFLTGFGSVQHDLGQFDQMTDFPDGGDPPELKAAVLSWARKVSATGVMSPLIWVNAVSMV